MMLQSWSERAGKINFIIHNDTSLGKLHSLYCAASYGTRQPENQDRLQYGSVK